MIKNLFKDSIKYLPSIAIPAIIRIIAIPIITRLFSPADYGSYVLVMAIVSVMSTVVNWIGISIGRFYPAYERDGKTVEFTNLTIKLAFLSILVISIILLCILTFLRSRISQNVYHLMGIGIFVFILTSLFSVLLVFLRIKRQIKWYSGFFVWQNITTLAFGVSLVIFFRLGVEGLLWGTIISVGFALPFLWKITVGRLRIRGITVSLKPTIEMVKFSFPLVVGNTASWILSLSDRYILELFRGSLEVGIYSVSYSISQYSIITPISLFFLSFNPLSIIAWEKEGEKATKKFIIQGTRYFLLLCIPVVIGISVLRNLILSVLSTQDYYEGAKIIPLVALGVFFFGLMQIFDAGLCLQKKTYINMSSVTLSGILNLGLNFLLIPRYGYVAAALTTLISYAFLLFLMITMSRRFFVWEFPFKSLAKATFASGVMGIVVYHIGNNLTSSNLLNLILDIVTGVVVYSLMLFLLREFKPNEIQALLDLKRQFFHNKENIS